MTEQERAARIELAALYRLVDLQYGCGEGIYNQITARVPGEPDFLLIKEHALLYEEVTASNLIKVDMQSDPDEGSGVNRPGFTLHSAIYAGRPDVNCAIHIHTTAGLAMSAHAGGLRMMSQNALRFYGRIGYHPYQGIIDDLSERAMIQQALAGDNIAAFLRNHGLVTVGPKPRDAFERLRDLVIACETQLMLEGAGAPIVDIPAEICERVGRQYVAHDAGRGSADWPAWLRMLERRDPSFKF